MITVDMDCCLLDETGRLTGQALLTLRVRGRTSERSWPIHDKEVSYETSLSSI